MPKETLRRNNNSKNSDRLERASVARSRASVVESSSDESDDEHSDDSPKEGVHQQERIEEDDEMSSSNKEEPSQIPDSAWSCEHCTFVNEPGTRVCVVCCKTPTSKVKLVKSTPPAKKPSLTAKKPPVGRTANTITKIRDKNKDKVPQSLSSDDYSANSTKDYSETESVQNRLDKLNINNLGAQNKTQETKTKGRTMRKISFWPGTKFTASFYKNK